MAVHLVFVYGTLKRDEPNHEKYMKKPPGVAKIPRFLGRAELTGKLPLVVASRHNVSQNLSFYRVYTNTVLPRIELRLTIEPMRFYLVVQIKEKHHTLVS